MHRLAFRLLVVLCLLSLLTGCVTKQVKTQDSSDSIKPVVAQPVAVEDVPLMQALDDAMQNARFEEASQLAVQLLEKYPNNAALHINLGVIDLRLEQFDEALAHLEKGCSLDKGNVHGLLFMGQALVATARYKEAETVYLRALSLDKESLYAHYGLGVIYDLYLMDYDLAEVHYQAFIDGAGDNAKPGDVKRVKMWKRLLKRKQS